MPCLIATTFTSVLEEPPCRFHRAGRRGAVLRAAQRTVVSPLDFRPRCRQSRTACNSTTHHKLSQNWQTNLSLGKQPAIGQPQRPSCSCSCMHSASHAHGPIHLLPHAPQPSRPLSCPPAAQPANAHVPTQLTGPSQPLGTGRILTRTPAAKASLFTGSYASIAGLALVVAPYRVFGLVFNIHELSVGWIRVGGILFALIGMQYFGAGLMDTKIATNTQQPASNSSVTTSDTAPVADINTATGDGDQVTGQSPSLTLNTTAPDGLFVYSKGFYQSSIISRLFLSLGFFLLVLTGQSPAGLLILAALNVAGALTMWLALKKTDKLLRTTR